MLSRTSIKLSKTICERARRVASDAGYSSVEEFIEHTVEKELAKLEAATEEEKDKEEMVRQLKGLGYLE